jgi:hypothetical protein
VDRSSTLDITGGSRPSWITHANSFVHAAIDAVVKACRLLKAFLTCDTGLLVVTDFAVVDAAGYIFLVVGMRTGTWQSFEDRIRDTEVAGAVEGGTRGTQWIFADTPVHAVTATAER